MTGWWILALYLTCGADYEHRVLLPDEATCESARAELVVHHGADRRGSVKCLAPGEDREPPPDWCDRDCGHGGL